VLRRPSGEEQQLTEGPLDATPMFLSDGRRWVYSTLAGGGQIVECVGRDRPVCEVLHVDPLVPGFPSPSPSGDKIAYLTLMNVTRLRVVNAAGEQKDLGPIGGDKCAPFWIDDNRLWAAQTSGPQTAWAEFDLAIGGRTGKSVSARPRTDRECEVPPDLRAARIKGRMPSVFVVSEESSELFRKGSVRGSL